MKLTVFVTVYNIAEYLPRFFESMANQTFRDYVLLMIDDGSEDNSLEVCNAYAADDERIEVVHLEHVGIAKARNYALGHINTEFTASADGDDYVEPDYLKHLMDVREKHDADLVISRVQYMLEDGTVEGVFRSRGKLFIPKTAFAEQIPMLLDDRRLNYLYGKVYRTDLLKDIRIEDDVRQGSDTMINFQYLNKADSVVLIDDVDYHYIRYSSRSVTSYSGEDAFFRISRINKYVYDYSEKMDILTPEMLFIIDSRVLQSAIWVIDKIIASDNDEETKDNQITNILNDSFYIAAYKRRKEFTEKLPFEAIEPQGGKIFLNKYYKKVKKNHRKAKILKATPAFIVDLYHKVKG